MISDCVYIKGPEGDNIAISAMKNGEHVTIPIDPDNRDYQYIIEHHIPIADPE